MSMMLFNVVAENVIRTWLAMMVEDQRVDKDGQKRDRWVVRGSLLRRQWHGHIAQPRLAAACNECPGRPV